MVKGDAEFCLAFKFDSGGTEIGSEVLATGANGNFENSGARGDGGMS